MFKQLKTFLLLGTLVFLLSRASAAAAAGAISDGSYCGSDRSGSAFQVTVRSPALNVTAVNYGQTCQLQFVLQVINGNVFTYPSPTVYNPYCSIANNLAIAFKGSNAVLSYSDMMGAAATVTASQCGSFTEASYCGTNKWGHTVALLIGSTIGSNYYYLQEGLTPIGLAYRSNKSFTSSAPWTFDCTGGGSALFGNGTLATTGISGCFYSLSITSATSGGFVVTFSGGYAEQVSVQVTTSGCQSVSGTYYGTAGSYQALISANANGAVLSFPPLRVAVSMSSYYNPIVTIGPSPYFVIGGKFFIVTQYSGMSSYFGLNVTSLTFASNAFTLSYYNRTAQSAKLSQNQPVTLPNSTFCGTAGNRSVFLFVGSAPVGFQMVLTEVVAGSAVCSATINGLILSSGATVIGSASGSCTYQSLSLTYSASAGFTVNTGSWKLTLASCTSSQPAGRFCGGTSANFVVLDTSSQSLQLISPSSFYPICQSEGISFFVGSSGALVNTSNFWCSVPLQVVSFKSGVFTAKLNGATLSLSKTGCAAPLYLNGTFCGASSSVYASLQVSPGYTYGSYTSPSSITLQLGSTTTGFSAGYVGYLNPSLATSTSLLVSLQSFYSSQQDFNLTSLVTGTTNSTLTITGQHAVLGAVKVTLSLASCGAVDPNQAYCGISGSQEVYASGGGVSIGWLNASVLTICQVGSYTLISGKPYFVPSKYPCPIKLPVNVTGIAATSSGLTASLKTGTVASSLSLTSATCPKSIIPTSVYCGAVGGVAVVANFEDYTSSAISFGTCLFDVEVVGVLSSGQLKASVSAASANAKPCPGVKSITWRASTASLTVVFSNGSATLTDCGNDPASDGKYCGLVGQSIVTMQYYSGRVYLSTTDYFFYDPTANVCQMPFSAVYNNGKYIILPSESCSVGSTSIAPTSMSFANGAFSVTTIAGVTGKLQKDACAFPLSTFCGVDAKSNMQYVFEAANGRYGQQFFLRVGNTTGGRMKSSELQPIGTLTNALMLNVNAKKVLLSVSPAGAINVALTNFYFDGMPVNISVALSKSNC